jgi:MFS family permease
MTDAATPGAPQTLPPARPLLRRGDMRALLFSLFIAGAGQTFSFAVLPALGRRLDLSSLQMSLVITLAAVVFIIGGPVWGRVSDIFGRRRVILFGGACYGATTALFGLAAIAGLEGWIESGTALVCLIAARMLFALLSGGMFPASFAYIADNTTREARSSGMALAGASFGLGAVAGPALAAGVAGFGLPAPFFLFAGLASVASAFCWFTLKAPERKARGPSPSFRITDKRFIPLMVYGVLVFMTVGSLQQATGFYLQDILGVSPEQSVRLTGIAITAASFCSVLMQAAVAQRLKWAPKRMLAVGAITSCAGAALFVAAEPYWLMVAAVGMMGAGFGLADPGLAAGMSLLVGPTRQGMVAGLGGMTRGMGFMLGPLMGGATYAWSPSAPYAISVVLLALAFGLALMARVPKPEDQVT